MSGLSDLPDGLPADRATFSHLVTALYKWFQEASKNDVDFLLGQGSVPELSKLTVFRKELASLRHAEQHNADAETRRRAQRWFRDASGTNTPDSIQLWETCAGALLKQAEEAVRVILALVRLANNDPLAMEQWARARRSRSLDLKTALASALALVGRSPLPSDVAFLGQRLDSQWARYSIGDGATRDQREALEAAASMVVAQWAMRPLLASPSALGGVDGALPSDGLTVQLLAHALQASGIETGLDEATTQAWKCLRASGIV